jgi:hypothetical protein
VGRRGKTAWAAARASVPVACTGVGQRGRWAATGQAGEGVGLGQRRGAGPPGSSWATRSIGLRREEAWRWAGGVG